MKIRDKIEKNAEQFKRIVSNWALGHFPNITRQGADEYADNIILNYTTYYSIFLETFFFTKKFYLTIVLKQEFF